MFVAQWQSVQWDGDFNQKRLPRRRRKSSKRWTFFTAPRNDVLVGVSLERVVIARRMKNLQSKKNFYCAAAICSLGEWDFNRNRLPRRRRKSPKRLTFFTAPRNDVLVGVGLERVVIARRMRNFKLKKNVCCAVAICSLGEWDFNRNRLPRRRRKSSKRWTFFPAPRNDVLGEEIATSPKKII